MNKKGMPTGKEINRGQILEYSLQAPGANFQEK
jgi:hypothetical protein